MTKEVLVSISGLQMAVNAMESMGDEPVEIISAGTYYFKDGKHYIFMEEVAEGFSEVTKTQIRIHGTSSLEVMKKGVSNVHMIFEKNRNYRCCYHTPFGQLNLGICTERIVIEESEDEITANVKYAMSVNGEPLADCAVRIKITPRGKCLENE